MIARRKPKKGAVASRVKQMFDNATEKGEKRYQSDLSAARRSEQRSKPDQSLPQGEQSEDDKQETYAENNRKRAVNATPSKDVEAREGSGMYKGSVPVAGTDSKKLMAKRNPIKGIRNSDAKASVKRAMAKKMRSSVY